MSRNIIFYYTGTGNSLKVAKDIANKIGDCEEVLMTQYSERKLTAKYERIGFVFPVYYAGTPLCVQKFLEEMDFSETKDAYFFSAITLGGSIGNTGYLIEKIFSNKKMKLDAIFKIKMQKNYIVSYNIKEHDNNIYQESEESINLVTSKVMNKEIESISTKENIIFRIGRNKVIGKIHTMDKNFNVSHQCTGCTICSSVCAVENIIMNNNMPTFQHKCEQCLACVHVCPQKAINYKNKTQTRNRYIHRDIQISELGVQR